MEADSQFPKPENTMKTQNVYAEFGKTHNIPEALVRECCDRLGICNLTSKAKELAICRLANKLAAKR